MGENGQISNTKSQRYAAGLRLSESYKNDMVVGKTYETCSEAHVLRGGSSTARIALFTPQPQLQCSGQCQVERSPN